MTPHEETSNSFLNNVNDLMPRFVVLTHDHPCLHWDFMLEQADSLRTWRLSAEPNSGGEISAEPLPDHRIEYLDYEGPLSGNRGEVTQWDQGEYEVIEESQKKLSVRLHGENLKGTATLQSGSENTILNSQLAIRNPQRSHCPTFSFVPE